MTRNHDTISITCVVCVVWVRRGIIYGKERAEIPSEIKLLKVGVNSSIWVTKPATPSFLQLELLVYQNIRFQPFTLKWVFVFLYICMFFLLCTRLIYSFDFGDYVLVLMFRDVEQ